LINKQFEHVSANELAAMAVSVADVEIKTAVY
jgi:hypothetical protein